MTTTDGTQNLFEWKNGAYRLQRIMDRNGNYITINHDVNGLLRTVTDTLGRVVTVNYNTDGTPSSVTQVWKTDNGTGSDFTRTYANFSYATKAITTNFNDGTNAIPAIGPSDGYLIKVLQKVTFPTETDGAGLATSFEYNTYGQVVKVTNTAADNHVLNYTKVNLPETASGAQADCPRFSETRTWVENFNQDGAGAAQETLVTNTLSANEPYSLPDGHSGTATRIIVKLVGDPTGHESRTYVGASGWREGLPIATEDWANGTSGGERKRWTWTDWTQDDTGLAYILNPRSIESKVGDTTNVKRSTTEYLPISENSPTAKFGLVWRERLYDTDQATVIKELQTTYIDSSAYTSRRIVSLPSRIKQWGINQQTNQLELVTDVSYRYDEGDFSDSSLIQNPTTVVQHDAAGYGSLLTLGRGNLTSVTRHDVAVPTPAVTSSIRYNTAGGAVESIDPAGGAIKIAYGDNFNDTLTSRNTFAYPTKITDPAGNSSLAKYRFDMGLNVWAKSPAPAGNTNGKETARFYGSSGRIEQETILNTGAYVKYESPRDNVRLRVFSTIVDVDGDNNIGEDAIMSETWTDGAGRIRKFRTEHPGSVGGWSGTISEYDMLGQVRRTTVPTEITVPNPDDPETWAPAGDDAARGFLWKEQEYDWKGRTTRIVNTDGTDQLLSYEGCGCAGGVVTTLKGEQVLEGRRTQKTYADILGRTYKTEVLNWDGSVYSTVKSLFNGRDQAVAIKQFEGPDSSNLFQVTLSTFDGYGRLKTHHRPEQQNTDGSAAFTTYTYNSDDSTSTVTDARGAVANFVYGDSRGLVTNINYTVPAGSTIPVTPSVNFGYDNAGNRISMSDGFGTVTYQYNELSQMTAETRQFSEILAGAPSNGYRMEYEYSLSGQLKSYKDPYGR